MAWSIRAAARLVQAGKRAYERKWSFLGAFVSIFLISVLTAARLGLLPETAHASAGSSASVHSIAGSSKPFIGVEDPVKIAIPAIGLEATIANPMTTAIEVLDRYLLSGAVRYPTSAKLNETGNMVIFGHSSYLPIVGNRAYKTFNGIQKLVAGDTITVYSSDTAYAYRVTSVTKESANDASIPLAIAGRVLTLATCDSFGAKTDRFIVTADFVGSQPISK